MMFVLFPPVFLKPDQPVIKPDLTMNQSHSRVGSNNLFGSGPFLKTLVFSQ